MNTFNALIEKFKPEQIQFLSTAWNGEESRFTLGKFTWIVRARTEEEMKRSFSHKPYLLVRIESKPKAKYMKEVANYQYVYSTELEAFCMAFTEMNVFEERMKEKEEKRSKIKELNKTLKASEHFKIGDIIVNTWGYEQTNVEFYQVIGMTEKTIKVREVSQKSENMYSHGMACNVMPDIDNFLESEKPFNLLLKYSTWNNNNEVIICQPSSHYYFHKWSGKSEYKSWYA